MDVAFGIALGGAAAINPVWLAIAAVVLGDLELGFPEETDAAPFHPALVRNCLPANIFTGSLFNANALPS